LSNNFALFEHGFEGILVDICNVCVEVVERGKYCVCVVTQRRVQLVYVVLEVDVPSQCVSRMHFVHGTLLTVPSISVCA
jgi:hypothetical protein